jgi:hypothetical protein
MATLLLDIAQCYLTLGPQKDFEERHQSEWLVEHAALYWQVSVTSREYEDLSLCPHISTRTLAHIDCEQLLRSAFSVELECPRYLRTGLQSVVGASSFADELREVFGFFASGSPTVRELKCLTRA